MATTATGSGDQGRTDGERRRAQPISQATRPEFSIIFRSSVLPSVLLSVGLSGVRSTLAQSEGVRGACGALCKRGGVYYTPPPPVHSVRRGVPSRFCTVLHSVAQCAGVCRKTAGKRADFGPRKKIKKISNTPLHIARLYDTICGVKTNKAEGPITPEPTTTTAKATKKEEQP